MLFIIYFFGFLIFFFEEFFLFYPVCCPNTEYKEDTGPVPYIYALIFAAYLNYFFGFDEDFLALGFEYGT